MVGYCFWDRRQQLFPQLGRVPGDVFDFHPIRGKASRDVGSNKGPMRLKGSGFNSALGIPPADTPPEQGRTYFDNLFFHGFSGILFFDMAISQSNGWGAS